MCKFPKVFATCFLVIGISIQIIAQNPCTTPVGESGQCVPLMTCSVIQDILQNSPKPLSQRALYYLQQSQCSSPNGENFVCCSPRHIKAVSGDDSISFRNEGFQDVSNHPNIGLHPIADCGDTTDGKISSGNSTVIGEFPWMALLQYDTPDGLAFRCAGSLISNRYILTAAHCIKSAAGPLVAVRLGEHDLSTEKDCVNSGYCAPPVQDIEVEETIIHPNYNTPLYANDIALIRLKNEAEFIDENVLPVCLPINKQSQKSQLDKMIIAGWGLTEFQVRSDKLLKANVPILPNDACSKIFGRITQITSSQICAGGESGKGGQSIDNCRGDSGGPLVSLGNVRGPRFVQYGVISAGARVCGNERNYPGIYTSVSFYIKWIFDQLRP